jgi:putative membrane protein
MDIHSLPHLNAALNGVSFTCLIAGYLAIRRKRVPVHRAFMLSAFAASSLFLISYVTYHYNAGSRPFPGTGLIRPIYFGVLLTHIILAAIIVPLALMTLRFALKGDIDRHRRIAKWTFPIWAYVSASGLLVYFLLYHAYQV